MKHTCQWVTEDDTVCGESAEHEQRLPIALGATGVIFLCDAHKAKFNQLMRKNRRLAARVGYTRGDRDRRKD
jgi:hypothetical protein